MISNQTLFSVQVTNFNLTVNPGSKPTNLSVVPTQFIALCTWPEAVTPSHIDSGLELCVRAVKEYKGLIKEQQRKVVA